ncbi:MAG TPA: PQQ-binding-like beta-propeller repeat protein [Tepidisphaeraceae bacterium]|jgi:hypothetical protein
MIGWVLLAGGLALVAGWAVRERRAVPPVASTYVELPALAPWPPGGPRRAWEREVGLGYASPVARDGTVYVFAQQGTLDCLTAMDAQTGQVRWKASYACTIRADSPQAANPVNHLPLPGATPVIDGDAIFTLGGGGDLACRDRASGAERWSVNILHETGGKILTWNQQSTPLVTADRVYVQGGKNGPTAIAFDKATGHVAWRSEAGTPGGYAEPVLIDVGGTHQLIVFGGEALYAMDPRTGRTIWTEPWATNYGINAARPIFQDGHLFASSNYNMGARMLTVLPDRARVEWRRHLPRLTFQPAALDRGFLYANSAGLLTCMGWPGGQLVWDSAGGDHDLLDTGGSLIRHNDDLILLSENGRLSLVHATPAGYRVVSTFQATEGESIYAHPLLDGSRLFVKGPKTLACFDLAERPPGGHK